MFIAFDANVSAAGRHVAPRNINLHVVAHLSNIAVQDLVTTTIPYLPYLLVVWCHTINPRPSFSPRLIHHDGGGQCRRFSNGSGLC